MHQELRKIGRGEETDQNLRYSRSKNARMVELLLLEHRLLHQGLLLLL